MIDLAHRDPVAIVDIGSNSVRLVAYQALTRALTPIFNEKAMCALGKGVVVNGRLSEDGVAKALKALRRFRALCETMQIADVTVIATAASRPMPSSSHSILVRKETSSKASLDSRASMAC